MFSLSLEVSQFVWPVHPTTETPRTTLAQPVLVVRIPSLDFLVLLAPPTKWRLTEVSVLLAPLDKSLPAIFVIVRFVLLVNTLLMDISAFLVTKVSTLPTVPPPATNAHAEQR